MKEFRKAQGEVFVRQGVKKPWYEIEVRKKDGSKVKLVAKIVDKFISESWDQEKGEAL